MVSEPAVNMAGDVSPHDGKVEVSAVYELAKDSSKYCGCSCICRISLLLIPSAQYTCHPRPGSA